MSDTFLEYKIGDIVRLIQVHERQGASPHARDVSVHQERTDVKGTKYWDIVAPGSDFPWTALAHIVELLVKEREERASVTGMRSEPP